MQNLSHTIRKFNRFELKYIVPIRAAEAFKHDLKDYLAPDEHGDAHGSYPLSSLYYDSPDYRCYWEKVDGIKFRRKLRIRHYENGHPLGEQTPVYLEIKQRLNRVTQKRRVMLPYREALHLCNQRQMPTAESFQHHPSLGAILEEAVDMLWQYNLQPASLVSYARQALVGGEYDVGLRVTFDRDLTYRAAGENRVVRQANQERALVDGEAYEQALASVREFITSRAAYPSSTDLLR
jgi:hypothetical protein